MSNYQSSHAAVSLETEIVRQVEFNPFAWSLLVSYTGSESEMLSEIRPNCGL